MAPLQGNNLYRAIISKEIEKRDRYFILKENCIKSFLSGVLPMRSRFRRNRKGNQIAELAPAIFIILVVFLFPIMVLLYIGLGYACGWFLNHMCTRAAAIVEPSAMPTALASQQAAWQNTGLAAFTKATVLSNTAARINLDSDPEDDIVRVTTTIQIEPLVIVPFIPLNPLPFTFVGERPVEEQGIK